ncbi:MAG: beta-N-acetylhexosaminidase [Oscillospiraceae bacterium]|nr:beta-N-acetylhexosaminidase [Oscillospiraceae bacterium]
MIKKIIGVCVVFALTFSFTFGENTRAVRLEQMTIDEKIGQMMCLDFRFWNEEDLKQTENPGIVTDEKVTLQKPVTEINDEIREIIAKYHIGSVILFSQNFVNPEQSKRLINNLQEAAVDAGNPRLIIAVDQEGGRVERFAFGREKLKNNAEIKTAKEAFKKGKTIGRELAALGINCNFAPVVDVNSNPKNPVINVRSFGDNAQIVSEFGKKFMDGLHRQNVIATAKHFPGHGDTDVDSHLGLPRVNKTLEELKKLELAPFKEMIDAGVDMIMTAHIELPKIENKTFISLKDGSKIFIPATLSKTILTYLLRNEMGFDGVIITDAMNMRVISDNFEEAEAVKMAIAAGANIVCMPVILRSKKDIARLDSVFKTAKNAVDSGEIPESQINESVARILKLKDKYVCS